MTRGHNDAIRETGIIAAGKTGTASKTMDTWFIGYTSRWSAITWLGDEKYERPLGAHDAAHLTTAPMFARFMYDAGRFYPLREIPWRDEKGKALKRRSVRAADRGHRPHFHPPKEKPPLAPR